MRGRLTRRSSIVVLAVTGTFVLVGIGYAGIPGVNGVIHGCYGATGANPSGQLRVIDAEAGAKCAKNEKSVDFNQQGPKGDTGARGPQGEIGPEGPQGEPGTDGVTGFTETLPSGKTLKGAWSVHGHRSVAHSATALGGFSFGIPLGSDWTYNPPWKLGGTYNSNCPGSPSDPRALPGHLCVYISRSSNVMDDTVAVFDPIVGAVGSGSRFGAGVSATGAADGRFYAMGTWAVTAR